MQLPPKNAMQPLVYRDALDKLLMDLSARTCKQRDWTLKKVTYVWKIITNLWWVFFSVVSMLFSSFLYIFMASGWLGRILSSIALVFITTISCHKGGVIGEVFCAWHFFGIKLWVFLVPKDYKTQFIVEAREGIHKAILSFFYCITAWVYDNTL